MHGKPRPHVTMNAGPSAARAATGARLARRTTRRSAAASPRTCDFLVRQPLDCGGRRPAPLVPEVVVQAAADAGAQVQDSVGAGVAPSSPVRSAASPGTAPRTPPTTACSRSVAAHGLHQCAAYPLLGYAPGSVAHSRAQGGASNGQTDRTDDVQGNRTKALLTRRHHAVDYRP